MTSKERMLCAMRNKKPDMVPVAPDMSNMIPCRLTGKPFWDIYLYNNPPLWKVYIDAVKYFGFDGWLCSVWGVFDEVQSSPEIKGTSIVFKSSERIITREFTERNGKKEWSEFVTVYFKDNPPSYVKASLIDIPADVENYYPVEGVSPHKKDEEILREVLDYMGDRGVVGVSVCPPSLGKPDSVGYSIYDYYDRYDEVKQWSVEQEKRIISRLEKILSSSVRPDFILTGGSGLLIFNTPAILRDISLPSLQKITKMCREAGIPSQVHCCGPEKEVIKMCAEETELDSINPIEPPPMGDCNLKEIKKQFGGRLSLMGNLHTTEVMLRGSADDVEEAAKQAMDDAAENGGFILSTADQCGRDTPDANIFRMIETARTYGKY